MATTQKMTPTQRFWKLLKPDRREITNVYVYSIFDGLVNLSLPLGIQAIINLIQGGQVSTSWVVLVAIVVLGVGVTGVLQIFQLRITENLQQKIFARAAFEFAYRMPRVKMSELYKKYAPELMNRFFDIVSVQKGLPKILIDFSASALQVIFGLILLSFYHPFFILFGLLLLLLVLLIFRFTGQKGLDKSLDESKFKYKVAHWLQELARAQLSFKLTGETNLPLAYTNAHVSSYLINREKHFKVLVQQYSLMVGFQVLVATGLLAIGGILVMEEQMNIGQFVAAEIIILLVMNSVKKLILSLETIYDVLTSLEKIGQVTDLELESSDGIHLDEECDGCAVSIKAQNLGLTLPGANTAVLHHVNFHVKSGQKVTISGTSGSGKTAILYAISALYPASEGSISIDGYSLNSVYPESLRTVIGECFSQQNIFEGTVMENITMGRDDITLGEVQEVVKSLRLNAFVDTLPKGINTFIPLNSSWITKDVFQKLLLARAVVGKPKLLLLDTPFYHIRTADREAVMNYIMAKETSWTVIVVSASKDVAEMSDSIVLMNKGTVVAQGEFAELSDKLNFKNIGYA